MESHRCRRRQKSAWEEEVLDNDPICRTDVPGDQALWYGGGIEEEVGEAGGAAAQNVDDDGLGHRGVNVGEAHEASPRQCRYINREHLGLKSCGPQAHIAEDGRVGWGGVGNSAQHSAHAGKIGPHRVEVNRHVAHHNSVAWLEAGGTNDVALVVDEKVSAEEVGVNHVDRTVDDQGRALTGLVRARRVLEDAKAAKSKTAVDRSRALEVPVD